MMAANTHRGLIRARRCLKEFIQAILRRRFSQRTGEHTEAKWLPDSVRDLKPTSTSPEYVCLLNCTQAFTEKAKYEDRNVSLFTLWSCKPTPGCTSAENSNLTGYMHLSVHNSTITLGETWKQPKCPSIDEWIRKMWYMRTVEFSVQFSRSVMSGSLQPHESQHARPPCPSQTPRVHSNSCPSSQWCHPAISSSVVPFSSCPQSLPTQGLFQWVNSSHQVAKVLELQLQHQSFQWTPRTDLL